MPTFGFSAYLKLICLNDKQQMSEIRRRLLVNRSAYDFHRSLRLRANRYLAEGASAARVLSSTDEITKLPERRSARKGLEQLIEWRRINPAPTVSCDPVIYESPNGIFKVSYVPDFAISLNEQDTAIHIWNTAKPPLDPRMVYGALSLFPEIYERLDISIDDLAVLSLRQLELYKLNDAPPHERLGLATALRIEEVFQQALEDIEETKEEGDEHPPSPPHPGI